MKFLNPTMLLAAVSALAFTSALNSSLESRQGQVIDTAQTVADCANGPDCKLASTWWNSYQGARVLGQPFDPSSNVRSCLCPPGRAVPSHIDWYSKFRNCIICVEMAAGTQHHGPPMYMEVEKVAGAPGTSVGYCHGTLSTEQFVDKMKALVKEKAFPLALPEAVLRPAGGEVARAMTSIALAIPTTAPTALPNSVFSTFPAVPMSSVLASISAASSSTPTAVPNSLFSTFEAVPMESFLASLSTATQKTSTSCADSSKRSDGIVFTPVPSATKLSCNHDNCFRAAIRSEPAVMSFCATYTKAPGMEGTGFPSCLSACNNSPARISSACSCLASHTSSISSALPTSTPATLKPTVSSSSFSSSVSPTMSTMMSSSSTRFTTSSSTSAPLPTSSSSGWASLPASSAIMNCSNSTDCQNAGRIFQDCASQDKQGGDSQQCLCTTRVTDWKTNLFACTTCIASALPDSPPSTAPYENQWLVGNVKNAQELYCSRASTDTIPGLTKAGEILTFAFQSPINFWDMTLLTQPIPAQSHSSIV